MRAASRSDPSDVPADVAAAWDEHGLDAVAEWLLSTPEVELLGRFASEMAAVLAEVSLPIDPALSLKLAFRLLHEGDANPHLRRAEGRP